MVIKHNVDKKKLFFLNVPDEYTDFAIVEYGYAGTWLMETNNKSLNHWKMNIPKGKYKVLGFTKDVIVEDINIKENFVLEILN